MELTASAAPKRRKTGYAHPITHYVAIYQTEERGLKVWIKKGRVAGEPPPLDDPEAMPVWWTRHSPQVVPAKLTLAAQRAAADRVAGTSSSPVSASATSAGVAAGADAEASPPLATEQAAPLAADGATPRLPTVALRPRSTALLDEGLRGLTLADAIPRLERVLAHALRDWEAKASDPHADEASIQLADARLNRAIERHRKLETTILESAEKRGELVAVLELRLQLAAIFGRLSSSLVDETMASFGIPRERAVSFVDGWFARVRELPYGDTAAQPAEPRAA